MQVKSKPIQNVNGHNLGKNLTQKQDNLAWEEVQTIDKAEGITVFHPKRR